MAVQYNPGIVTDGLLFCYDPANQKSYPRSGVTFSDSLAVGNVGILSGGPSYSSSNSGTINFDGTDDWINFGTWSPAINTICFWINFNTNQNGPIIYLGDDTYNSSAWSWSSFIFSDSILFRPDAGGGGMGNEVASNNLGSWRMYTLIRRDTDTLSRVYKNTSVLATTTGNLTDTIQTGLRIAKSGTNYGNFRISSIMFYNRALTSVEVTQNFNALRGRFGI